MRYNQKDDSEQSREVYLQVVTIEMVAEDMPRDKGALGDKEKAKDTPAEWEGGGRGLLLTTKNVGS